MDRPVTQLSRNDTNDKFSRMVLSVRFSLRVDFTKKREAFT